MLLRRHVDYRRSLAILGRRPLPRRRRVVVVVCRDLHQHCRAVVRRDPSIFGGPGCKRECQTLDFVSVCQVGSWANEMSKAKIFAILYRKVHPKLRSLDHW